MQYKGKNFRERDIEKLLSKRWPNIIVFGSKPYHKGCILIEKRGEKFILLQEYPSNYNAFQEICKPDFDPYIQKQSTLFPMMEMNMHKPLLKVIVDNLKVVKELGRYFGINVDEQLETAIKYYKKKG